MTKRNNTIQISDCGEEKFLTKTPVSDFSISRFDNNVLAKKTLGIEFQVLGEGSIRSIKRKLIKGETLKEMSGKMDNAILQSLAEKLLIIHKHKNAFFGEDLVGADVFKLKSLLLRRLEKLSIYLDEKSLLNQLLKDKMKEARKTILSLGNVSPSFVHFDLHDENILWDGQEVHLIDFENSRYYDHVWDVAITIRNLKLTGRDTDFFLNCYFDGPVSKSERERIDLYTILNELRDFPYEH